jgi:hypothetical protein
MDGCDVASIEHRNRINLDQMAGKPWLPFPFATVPANRLNEARLTIMTLAMIVMRSKKAILRPWNA